MPFSCRKNDLHVENIVPIVVSKVQSNIFPVLVSGHICKQSVQLRAGEVVSVQSPLQVQIKYPRIFGARKSISEAKNSDIPKNKLLSSLFLHQNNVYVQNSTFIF